MAVSEDELQEKRDKNDDLRRQIAEAEANQAQEVAEATRENEADQLDAEAERLQAQLNAMKKAPAPATPEGDKTTAKPNNSGQAKPAADKKE